MQLVQLTVYEIFGYVFPGASAIVGLYLIYWKLFLFHDQDLNNISIGGWIALLAIAYVFGHFIQALTNLIISKIEQSPEERIFHGKSGISPELKSLLSARARSAVGLKGEQELDARSIYDISDHSILQQGKTDTREIYVYREGFYRGMTLSLLLITIGCLVRCFLRGHLSERCRVNMHRFSRKTY